MALRKNREIKKTKVEIIPMIDTMFFLLVFFILSSVGVVKLQGINVNLPKAASSSNPASVTKELTVAIDANSNISVNKIPVGASQDTRVLLRREIARQFGPNPKMDDVAAVISAHPAVPHGLVVQCIDQARDLGISKFAIASPPPARGAAPGLLTAPAAGAPK